MISVASSVTSLVSLSGTILSEGYSYLARARKAPKEIRLLLNEVAALNTLLDQFQLLLEESDNGTSSRAIQSLEKAGVIGECKELLETVQLSLEASKQIPGHSVKNLGKALLWPLKDKELKEAVRRFHTLRSTLTSALTVDSSSTLKRLEQSSSEIHDHTIRIEAALEQQTVQRNDAELIEWLGLDEVRAQDNLEAALELRQPGTGSWFLEDVGFKNWKEKDGSFLWVHGIPGSGKTVLFTTILEHLQEETSTSNAALAYFYCDYSDTRKQTLRNFISTGLCQLLAQNHDCMSDVQGLYDRKQNASKGQPNSKDLIMLLSSFASHFSRIFILVDALDECIELDLFFLGLMELRGLMSTRMLVTSRQEVHIQRYMIQNEAIGYPLASHIGKDISEYIHFEVQRRIAAGLLKLRDPALQHRIVVTLCEGAQSMFLWTKLQLDRICRLHTDKAIKAALESLPQNVEETYVRILEQVCQSHADNLKEICRVFRWIAGSTRLLSLEELAEAVAIEPEDTALDPDGVATDPEDIVAMCGSLVVIDRSQGVPHVGFAHYSVEEFLKSDLIIKTSASMFHIDTAAIDLKLAKTCIQYLCFSDFEIPCGSLGGVQYRLRKYKFLDYAAHGWYKHLRNSTVSIEEFDIKLKPKLQSFFQLSRNRWQFRSWQQVYHHPFLFSQYKSRATVDDRTLLYYTAYFGLDKVLNILLPTLSDVNISLPGGTSALNVAAGEGHVSVVQRLLEAGANINKMQYRNLTPLHVAAEHGHFHVVKTLIDSCASIHLESESGSTAFYRAARSGSLPTMQLLYDAGSDVNATTWDGWIPLHEAVENNHLAAVEALLKWGADVNVGGERTPNPLEIAKILPNHDIVSLLEPLTDPVVVERSIKPSSVYETYPRLQFDGDNMPAKIVSNSRSAQLAAYYGLTSTLNESEKS